MDTNCFVSISRRVWKENTIMNVFFVVMYILASWEHTVTAQKTGESCRMTNGVTGVCQSIGQCADAVNKALQGEAPAFCNLDSDFPIVCCESVQSKKPPRPKQAPWWLADNSFIQPSQTTTAKVLQFINNPPLDNENFDNPWWINDGSFAPSKPALLPPTVPPRQTPPPVTRSPRSSTVRSSERISELKCNEYSRLALEQVAALPLVPTPEPVRIDIPKCDFSSLELIVGGEETKPKEFPHMAALGYRIGSNIEWRCGGSLISDYYVLTAAHCIPNKNPPRLARLGELNLKRNDDGADPVNYYIVETKRHPDYKPPAKYNDIALLRLDRQVQFSDFIRPACLYTRNHFDVNKTVATGWGKMDFAEKQSDTLLKVAISIIGNKQCNELYESDTQTRLSKGIADSMMCAGELEGGKDTCQGDSGGPIQITRPNNQCVYSIIGITSFGKFCAAKNAPGVYTRVSSFIPWIEDIVWPES